MSESWGRPPATPTSRSWPAPPEYPGRFSCAELGARLQAAPGRRRGDGVATLAVHRRRRRRQRVRERQPDQRRWRTVLGFVALVHDLSFIELREAKALRFIWGGFGILAAILSVVGVVDGAISVAELDRRDPAIPAWRRPASPEFQPICARRARAGRTARRRGRERQRRPWTAERLKQTLHRHLHGEKIIIVANREPYIHDRAASGSIRVLHPASGLVTALEPVMRACSGVWVAHGAARPTARALTGADGSRCRPARSPTSFAASGCQRRRSRVTTTVSRTRDSGRYATSHIIVRSSGRAIGSTLAPLVDDRAHRAHSDSHARAPSQAVPPLSVRRHRGPQSRDQRVVLHSRPKKRSICCSGLSWTVRAPQDPQ